MRYFKKNTGIFISTFFAFVFAIVNIPITSRHEQNSDFSWELKAIWIANSLHGRYEVAAKSQQKSPPIAMSICQFVWICMNVNLQQCQFVKTRVRLVKYTCIFVETPQSSRSIYKGDFIRGVTTIRGNKRIVRDCYTVQRFCNLQQRARVTPRSKLLFRSLCTLVFMFNLPECEVKLRPNGLASRRKSTQVNTRLRQNQNLRTDLRWVAKR